MEPKLSKHLAGFRSEHNAHHALPKLTKTWRAILNKGNKAVAITMHLSKAFDALNDKLLICKSKAYGCNKNALTLIQSYFTDRHQRKKVGDTFSKWQKISRGMCQGAILGLLFSNILINDLCLFIETTTPCNYGDDNTVCFSDKNTKTVISHN